MTDFPDLSGFVRHPFAETWYATDSGERIGAVHCRRDPATGRLGRHHYWFCKRDDAHRIYRPQLQ
jgi:hypothetical protein